MIDRKTGQALQSPAPTQDGRVAALEVIAKQARKLLTECQALPPFSKVTKGWIIANLCEEIDALDALPATVNEGEDTSKWARLWNGYRMPTQDEWDSVLEGVLCGTSSFEIEFNDTARAYFKQAHDTILKIGKEKFQPHPPKGA